METKKKKKDNKNKESINEAINWFFEKINKIAKSTKRRRENTQINKIRGEKGVITTNTNAIPRIIRENTSKICLPVDLVYQN
jgi:hypothetical protein